MILVTGGAGFIGSALISYLNSQGITNIIVVDRLGSDEKWMNLRSLKFEHYVHADELFTEYKNLLPSIKTIYHMGACSETTEKNVDYLWKNNFLYSQKLFNYAAQNDVNFVYASSAATYGDGESGYDDHHEKIPGLRPLNPYGYSKQLFDEWVLRQKRFPRRWYGLKFFNVYGPNEYHKGSMVSVVYQAHKQIQASGMVKLFKSYRSDFEHGKQLRDFVYVKDVVKVMVELMCIPGKEFCGIYNVGTGKARSFVDLVNAVFDHLKKPRQIEFIEMPDKLKDQYQYFTEASSVKFKAALPHFEYSALEVGVGDYVTRYLEKKDPYLNSGF